VSEGRALEGEAVPRRDPLRAVPGYANSSVLLDTREVRRLVASERAIFVDVRYPADFQAQGHLPQTISFPIQSIPTADLPKAIAEIPKRPIVLPCYDRRSCFFADVAGIELTRAGYDVRGRYTQPWAYFVPRERPAYVDRWIAQSNQSLWDKAATYLADAMSAAAAWIGLPGAILLLAVISRLLVLPFSVKAERDQIHTRAVAGKLKTIKEELRNDPVRKARSVRALYKRHGLTPGRNLLVLVFLPIMALAVIAVQELADQATLRFPLDSGSRRTRSVAHPAIRVCRVDHPLRRSRVRAHCLAAHRPLGRYLSPVFRERHIVWCRS
jgi:rhodanese-related sulfurtransferase